MLDGFNCTIFAYGQTGTGKTHTMLGDCGVAGGRGELSEAAGVVPRAMAHVFTALEAAKAEYSVKCTFIELYNEEITDLLSTEDDDPRRLAADPDRRKLQLMEDGKGGVMVKGLEEIIVMNAAEVFGVLERCVWVCVAPRACVVLTDAPARLPRRHAQRHAEASHGGDAAEQAVQPQPQRVCSDHPHQGDDG